jgi:hypothetical protein
MAKLFISVQFCTVPVTQYQPPEDFSSLSMQRNQYVHQAAHIVCHEMTSLLVAYSTDYYFAQ